MRTIIGLRLRRFRRDRRGVSNIIVIALSFVIITLIVSNVVLWSYQMNQLDWEKMQESVKIFNVERITNSSWFTAQSEYAVNIGSRINGTYEDTKTVNDGLWETFREGQPPAAPSTVGTSTATSATQYPYQRKAVYANGRFWVFYSDGTNLVYRTSTDGLSWSSSTTVRASSVGFYFSIWLDGTYVHYTCGRGINNEALFYRQGTPNADGTIAWSAPEQIAVPAEASVYYYEPFVSVDSDGYPWIGYRRRQATTYQPYVTKSSTNDGTWTTAPNFPYRLSTVSSSAWRVSVVPLTVGKVYIIYARTGASNTKGQLWDGLSWGTEETVTSLNLYSQNYYSATEEGDDVHFVFLETSPYNIRYVKRTYGVGWGTPQTVQPSTTTTSAPALSISNSTLYCFWAGSPTAQHIYYKKCVGGTWDSAPTAWIEGQPTQSLETGNDLDEAFYSPIWKSQSFISLKDDKLWRIEIYAKRGAGTANVPINVAIFNADAEGKPTGTALGSGTIASFTGVAYAWRVCPFSTPISVSANQKYCLVISAPTGSSTQYYHWAVDSTSPPYADGNWAFSSDSGSTWTADASKDARFRSLFESSLAGNDRLTSYFKDTAGRIGLVFMTRTASPYNVKHEYLSLTQPLWALDLDGMFTIDTRTYPLTSIQGIEIQLRYKTSDLNESWHLKAYNWTSNEYNNVGFNSTGQTPTTGWNYHTVNITTQWRSYVQADGAIYVKLHDQGRDNIETTVDIDFLVVRVMIDGSRFAFKNEGALTTRLVSLWIINSTLHQHYNVDVVLNSAETFNYIRADIQLPSDTFVVKVVTEKGNMAIFSGG